ncbi:hypothetical protein RFI_10517 [Reticulomyxa filosa]|uniref:Uncharacterized protein n=1 Tax=Reticulomyxa filosa TaxID=46433 RepID=X6NLL5_RETFI|nr:hypothetical protein RFI_10517 [Reticulomyxa filosa]|eukprot:ETO26619.1 hypothetical protein RFI_10517 [Reticulomyxa filosa]
MHSLGKVELVTSEIQRNLNIGIDMANFFDYFHQGPNHYDAALQTIARAQLIPFTLSSISIDISRREQMLASFREHVRRLVKDLQNHLTSICLGVMKILAFQMDTIKRDLQYNPMLGRRKTLSAQCYAVYSFYGDLVGNKLMTSSQTNKEMQQLYMQTRFE